MEQEVLSVQVIKGKNDRAWHQHPSIIGMAFDVYDAHDEYFGLVNTPRNQEHYGFICEQLEVLIPEDYIAFIRNYYISQDHAVRVKETSNTHFKHLLTKQF